MKQYANLHLHSTYSDGVYSPSELVEIAKNEGYKALALTDHDTVTGCAELKKFCDREHLEFVFGTEFSSPFFELGMTYHLTAFNFSPEYPRMRDYLLQRSMSATNQTRVLFERGVKDGFISGISWSEILEYNKGITWLCNEHVFRAMKAKGISTDKDYPDFFRNVYGAKRAQVENLYPFMQGADIIKLVHDAGGIVCVAHPAMPYGKLEHIPRLVEMGVDGIEVWHNLLNEDERNEALKLALKYNLFISGGSDHDGLLGGQYARYEKPEETEFYAPEGTLGTNEEFFEEIRRSSLKEGRAELIKKYIVD